jgi:hypothetical protein
MSNDPIITLRSYAQEPFWDAQSGVQFWLWRRQSGKSFTAASKSLYRMMDIPGLSSFFCSASVNLAAEFLRKEVEVWQKVLASFAQISNDNSKRLEVSTQGRTGKKLQVDINNVDVLSELFESSKLETRIYHTNTIYSRSRVIAPNPDTAVGWTGDVWLDEVGRMPEFKDVLEAILPFMSSSDKYRLLAITTPPPDDSHYSWELFAPPADVVFTPNAKGNYYISQAGYRVHRVDVHDTELAGVSMYDDQSRSIISADEHRTRAYDKSAWDRNYALKFITGGATALSAVEIRRAMISPACGIEYNIMEGIAR